jgi:hypothetical protein
VQQNSNCDKAEGLQLRSVIDAGAVALGMTNAHLSIARDVDAFRKHVHVDVFRIASAPTGTWIQTTSAGGRGHVHICMHVCITTEVDSLSTQNFEFENSHTWASR